MEMTNKQRLMEPTNRPKLVVITPVRNEAWVLDAFLKSTSSWADHIIIADQYSTDGSREIAQRYDKVTLIDNPCHEWVEYRCRTALLEEAAKIEGDKIIFGLDADEFLSEDFDKTEGWQRIIHSTDNEIFCFRWFNLFNDFEHGMVNNWYSEWAAHYKAEVDVVEEYKMREKHAVHCCRVPCLPVENCHYTNIDDIFFVHLGNLNSERVRNKTDFYQVVNIDKNPVKASAINMYRSYSHAIPHNVPRLEKPINLYCTDGTTSNSLVNLSDYGKHYIDEMVHILSQHTTTGGGGIDLNFSKLHIYNNPYLQREGINPQLPLRIRLLHRYLSATNNIYQWQVIKVMDKIARRVYEK